ncbi:MAG: hypothetical protein JWM59_1216 [Verrucomicrobiales bacterium]|nr:hypothetical protein [Verrucomicrobiales bacterium]
MQLFQGEHLPPPQWIPGHISIPFPAQHRDEMPDGSQPHPHHRRKPRIRRESWLEIEPGIESPRRGGSGQIPCLRAAGAGVGLRRQYGFLVLPAKIPQNGRPRCGPAAPPRPLPPASDGGDAMAGRPPGEAGSSGPQRAECRRRRGCLDGLQRLRKHPGLEADFPRSHGARGSAALAWGVSLRPPKIRAVYARLPLPLSGGW